MCSTDWSVADQGRGQHDIDQCATPFRHLEKLSGIQQVSRYVSVFCGKEQERRRTWGENRKFWYLMLEDHQCWGLLAPGLSHLAERGQAAFWAANPADSSACIPGEETWIITVIECRSALCTFFGEKAGCGRLGTAAAGNGIALPYHAVLVAGKLWSLRPLPLSQTECKLCLWVWKLVVWAGGQRVFLESLSAVCGKGLGITPWKTFFCLSCRLGKL